MRYLPSILIASLLTACGSEEDVTAAPYDPFASHGHAATCPDEHDHFLEGMTRLTEAGLFEVELHGGHGEAGMMSVGAQTLTVYVLNPLTGAPRNDVDLAVEVMSPMTPEMRALPTEAPEPGAFAFDLDLSAPGLWTLEITLEGQHADRLRLQLCAE